MIMNVSELIERLKEFPVHTRVVVKAKKGFNDVEDISLVHLKLNASIDWRYGAHEISNDQGSEAISLAGTNRNATVHNDMAP